MPDKIILLTFAHALLLSFLLYIFPVYTAHSCHQFNIHHNSNNNGNAYTTNDTITFSSYSLSDKNQTIWIFSDNGIQTGKIIHHNFHTAGNYAVKAVSGNCSCSQTLLITTQQVIPSNLPAPEIEGESATITNTPIHMSASVPNNITCCWKTPDQDSTHYGNSTTFTFSRPGEKIIQLYNCTDSQLMAIKRIKVYPSIPHTPLPTPHPEKQLIPQHTNRIISISEEDFRFNLLQIISRQIKPSDILKYLCNPQHTPVLINDNQTNDLMAFCNQLYGKKKTQIQQVTLIKDSSGCIQEVRINVNKKRLINLF
ncbi:hypothetical protein [Chitinophaga sp. Cy-1792]|uniref:hypothetical protein n=1 Tax=Chitinophaga sp. Cy-1792 TaxID=2608339 RepID=UPI001420CC6F|nr:hypothetical protein [Chitinophaga sp. Cy-1792]NIG53730.1 hypothetical protein [Chitinophaga sp. Cy-1792]